MVACGRGLRRPGDVTAPRSPCAGGAMLAGSVPSTGCRRCGADSGAGQAGPQ
jgi:hypothetical protein